MSEPLEGDIVDGGHGSGQGQGQGRGSGRGGGRNRGGFDLARWRRMWLLPVGFGAAGVVLGVLMLAWPGHTVTALTYLFGVYLLLTGAYRFFVAVQLRHVDALARVVALVLAALSVGFGVVCLIRPFHAAATLALVVGAFWLASGALGAFGARQRRRAGGRRAPGMGGGVFAMIIGLLILLFPGASLVALAWILGLWLIVFGAGAVTTGVAARKLLHKVEKVRNAPMYWP